VEVDGLLPQGEESGEWFCWYKVSFSSQMLLSFYIILKPSTTFCFLYTFFIIPFVPIYFLSMPLFFVAEVWWEWKLGEVEPDYHSI